MENNLAGKVLLPEDSDTISKLLVLCIYDSNDKAYPNLKKLFDAYIGITITNAIIRELSYTITGNYLTLNTKTVLPCRLAGSCYDESCIIELQEYDPQKGQMHVLVLTGPHAGDRLSTVMTRDRAFYIASRIGVFSRRHRDEYRGINSLVDRLALASVVNNSGVCRVLSISGNDMIRRLNKSWSKDVV